MKQTKWPGNWKVACMVCGMWYPSSEIRERWDGILACKKDWETRHPQTMIRVRGESAVPDFVSKDSSPDLFVGICDVATSSGYADLATADCAQADNNSIPYLSLLDIYGNGHGTSSTPYPSIAGIAAAGLTISGSI